MVIRIEVQVELERPQGADARTTESLTGDRHMHQQHSSTAATAAATAAADLTLVRQGQFVIE